MLGIAFLAVLMVFSYSMIGCAVAVVLWLVLDRALDVAERRRSPRRARAVSSGGERAPARGGRPRRHPPGSGTRSRAGATAGTRRAGQQRAKEPSVLRRRAASGPSPRRR